jgi:membrane protease YdiL (CAAX protease family)
MAVLFTPLLLGCFAIYLYKFTGNAEVVWLGIVFFFSGTLMSAAAVSSRHRGTSVAAAGLTVVNAISLFIILVPRSGFIYADVAVVFVAVAGTVLLQNRVAELPYIGLSRLRESSVAAVLFLPMGLAVVQALFLGLRFWENFPIGKTSLFFIPCLAAWAYVEEGLFRGILQRSALPMLGAGGSIVFSALVYAAFSLFWGSLMYTIFSLLFGLLLGYLYLRSRSLMYVGTIHALTDTWMIIALLALGIVIP